MWAFFSLSCTYIFIFSASFSLLFTVFSALLQVVTVQILVRLFVYTGQKSSDGENGLLGH